MAVPAGIPLMLVFAGIFVFLVLFVACIVLSIFVKDTPVRVGLLLAALLLAGVMGGGAYLTMTDGEEEPAEAVVEEVSEPAPAAPAEAQQGDVVLIVDETTITEDYDPLKMERLSVEDPAKGGRLDGNARQGRLKVGRQVAAIEDNLNAQLLALESQVQEVLRRFDAQEMENYDMLFWQAKLKKQEYGLIVRAMDDKQRILEQATMLASDERTADITRVDKRRQKALEKWKEYHGVLEELAANKDAFHAL